MSKIKQVGNTTYLEETEKHNTFSNTANVSMPKELEEALYKLVEMAKGKTYIDENNESKNAEFIEKASELIKSALEHKEKLEKSWEIIKEKPQQYAFIRKYNITRYLREDLSYCTNENDEELLTETEFNLLKELLCQEN